MSFWNLSDGEKAKSETEFDAGGGNMEPIPAGTNALSMIDEVKWDKTKNGDEFVSIRWSVMKPEEYLNRKVFQKIWCKDLDPNAKDNDKALKKRDKAIRMLAAIDANAGGKLMKNGREPDDDDLQSALTGKLMIISLQQWKMKSETGEDMIGNWVSAVSAKGSKDVKAGTPSQKTSAPSASQDLDDDEIPF
jgi:hypothetical protein